MRAEKTLSGLKQKNHDRERTARSFDRGGLECKVHAAHKEISRRTAHGARQGL